MESNIFANFPIVCKLSYRSEKLQSGISICSVRDPPSLRMSSLKTDVSKENTINRQNDSSVQEFHFILNIHLFNRLSRLKRNFILLAVKTVQTKRSI